jgi:hypothetical protein
MANDVTVVEQTVDPAGHDRPALGSGHRLAGWCGIGMVAAILINGPLSEVVQRVPSYWNAGAGDALAGYLRSGGNVDQMVLFFALSNLIFVFAIGFFAGLRDLASGTRYAGWTRAVVSIGAALFLAGGLLSETLSTGIAVVLSSTPDYQLDTNSVLLLQGLWSTALAQGQVALGVVILAISAAQHSHAVLPTWLKWLGLIAGVIDLIRPALVAHPVLFVATFQPTFLWIAAVSVLLLRAPRRRSGRPAA